MSKEPITGLIDRQGAPLPKNPFIKSIDAFVVKVPWWTLQPAAFGKLDTSVIDNALKKLTTEPYSHMSIKLRVQAGVFAPEWVNRLCGSLEWVNPKADTSSVDSGSLPVWWGEAFHECYIQLHEKLAALYDYNPLVRGVMFSGATTLYDEAMARQFNDSVDNLYGAMLAGYRYDVDYNSIVNLADRQAALWENTPVHIALQPVNFASETAFFKPSYIANILHGYNIQNHSLSTDKIANKDFAAFYGYASEVLAGRFHIQTDSMNRIGDPKQVMEYAKEIGALSVELPQGYAAWKPEQFGGWLKNV